MQTPPARHTGALLITPHIADSLIEQHPHWPTRKDPDLDVVFTLESRSANTGKGPVTRRDATALIPVNDELRAAPLIAKQIQAVVDQFPTRTFAGHIQATPDDGTLPWRYTVNRRTRTVEIIKPRTLLLWPGDPEPGAPPRTPSGLARRIMAFFQAHPGEFFHGAEVARRLKSPPASLSNAMRRLHEQGLLDEQWNLLPTGRATTRVHQYRVTAKGLAWRA